MNNTMITENEDATLGIDGKGMHRGEHTGAHQEGTHQAQRKRQDGKQDRPDLERLALFHHQCGMKQRGAGKPRHEAEAFSTGSQNHQPPQPSS